MDARDRHLLRLSRAADRAVLDLSAGRAASALAALAGAYSLAAPSAAAAAVRARRRPRTDGPLRVAVCCDALGGMDGVVRLIGQLRARGVPGCDVDVIGTDAGRVDRRLEAATEVEIPFYAGLQVGVPALHDVARALADGGYELVHLTSPGPTGALALLAAKALGIPVLVSYHTELAAYAGIRSGDARLQRAAARALAAWYGAGQLVLSPSSASDSALAGMGLAGGRVARWGRGTDLGMFHPRAGREPLNGDVSVLYAGRCNAEKGVWLLADAYEQARDRMPGLHLTVCGGGPDEPALRERLGAAATFLGVLDGPEYAAVHAAADLFCFCSQTDTFGQVLVEAHASGTPVVAVSRGGPVDLVRDGVDGRLVPPDAASVADALVGLAGDKSLRERMGAAGRERAVASRSWEACFAQLAGHYRHAARGGVSGRAAERQRAGTSERPSRA